MELVLMALVPSVVSIGLLLRSDKRMDRIEANHAQERQDWQNERNTLLRRIQVPEAARTIDMPEPTLDENLYVDIEDDDSILAYQNEKQLGQVN